MTNLAKPTQQPTRFANLALGLDAAFCNVVGLVFTLTGGFMSNWLGVPGIVATGTGIVILGWALVVTLYANRRVTRRHELDRVIAVNGVAILASLAAVVIPSSLTTGGRWLVGIGGVLVLGFVIAQLAARRTLPLEPKQDNVTP